MNEMKRRRMLASCGTAAIAASAGCLGFFRSDGDDDDEPEEDEVDFDALEPADITFDEDVTGRISIALHVFPDDEDIEELNLEETHETFAIEPGDEKRFEEVNALKWDAEILVAMGGDEYNHDWSRDSDGLHILVTDDDIEFSEE